MSDTVAAALAVVFLSCLAGSLALICRKDDTRAQKGHGRCAGQDCWVCHGRG